MAKWEEAPIVTDGVTGMLQSPDAPSQARPKWMDAPEVDPDDDKPFLERTWLGRRVKDVADAAVGAYETAFPERDPRTADVPGFSAEGITDVSDLSKIERSKLTSAGFEDAPWRQAVMDTLGERVMKIDEDKFGNEIITYRGDNGQPHTAYINRPGLDYQDVERAVLGSVPYVVGAGATQKGLAAVNAGKTLLSRAPAQAFTAGAVSIGQDVAADQPIGMDSVSKAALTAAGGAAGEVVGTGLNKLWQRWRSAGMVDDAGRLTDSGRKEAQRLGLDPEDLQGRVAQEIGDIRRSVDPKASAAGIEAGEFGIPTTAGQRTKDPAQLNLEEQMRRSLFGQSARDVMVEFDQSQREAINKAAEAVRSKVAPNSAATMPEAGQGIGEGLRAAQRAADDEIAQAWAQVTPLRPVMSDGKTGDAARSMLTKHLRENFDGLGFYPDQTLTPTAHKMMENVTQYSRGLPESVPYEILGEASKGTVPIDDMRRRLLKQYQGAAPGQDRAAARSIYNAFNAWAEEATRSRLVRADGGKFVSKEAAKPMEHARTITREKRALFAPTDDKNKLTPAGKILTDLAENGDTPERIVQSLFGASVGTTPKAGTAGAVYRLRTVLKDSDPASWDQVKAAYFLKMITGSDGNLLSPTKLATSIDKAFANQPAIVGLLFDGEEKNFIRRFQNAVRAASYTPPNPSGTSYSIKKPTREGSVNYVLRRLGTRSTFQGKVWQGTMYHWLSRALPNILGVQEALNKSKATKAISQNIQFKPETGSLMAGISAAWENKQSGKEGKRE